MIRSYVRVTFAAIVASFAVPILARIGSRSALHRNIVLHASMFIFIGAALIGTLLLRSLLARLLPAIESASERQHEFLRTSPDRYIGFAICISALISMFLELAIIRWQASVFEVFAFYKNLSLLACFLGLGIGYALAKSRSLPLFCAIPLLAYQFGLLLGTRYGLSEVDHLSFTLMPFSEQLHMGLPVGSFTSGLGTQYLLIVVFLLTTLAFLPLGQLCGCLMERRATLRAYGLNLLGSILGVLLMFALSAFWTSPVIWFLLGLVPLVLFQVWKVRPLLFASTSLVLALAMLAWPADLGWQRIYSPYQLIEVGHDERGFVLIKAAGHYYQRILDLARTNLNVSSDPELKKIQTYYDLPYEIYGPPPQSVVIVGAGAGNDVAAALRSGAQSVDAVEIDPVILMEGTIAHPEHPYANSRVHTVITDARKFLHDTTTHYSVVAYGLLDSHTLLSQTSTVRLDSFVYTVQALKEARSRLTANGILSLSFTTVNPQLGRKLFLMLQDAFGGQPPLCIDAGYDGAVVFLEANDRTLSFPAELRNQKGFRDVTSQYSNPGVLADVSTDDWPFFYMPRRVYPESYVFVLAVVLLLSLVLSGIFINAKPQPKDGRYFLLGAGFMLIETKTIAELGLAFGNSWQVVGIGVLAILLMAFLANCIAHLARTERPLISYSLLMLAIWIGWKIPHDNNVFAHWGRLGLVILLASPVFFSGLVFSRLIRSGGMVASSMGMNLLGAMFGGVLEYNSMYFGFRFLYVLAACLYALAFSAEVIDWARLTFAAKVRMANVAQHAAPSPQTISD